MNTLRNIIVLALNGAAYADRHTIDRLEEYIGAALPGLPISVAPITQPRIAIWSVIFVREVVTDEELRA